MNISQRGLVCVDDYVYLFIVFFFSIRNADGPLIFHILNWRS